MYGAMEGALIGLIIMTYGIAPLEAPALNCSFWTHQHSQSNLDLMFLICMDELIEHKCVKKDNHWGCWGWAGQQCLKMLRQYETRIKIETAMCQKDTLQ